ncbi:hypothetical protein GQ43DRAFT_273325 [Delitschia confertaspora ATCC 74209]|uniref:Uncharacterized protein n=1 Tax=Delitschia confertaspora ATCC 74209 TaxID=1513339 RepID=A0A9P4MMQ2_9PLEO|nr:hypothetical protein GQ43DRAFT_273325 [Delitschia confertaspora ATCC 74209]
MLALLSLILLPLLLSSSFSFSLLSEVIVKVRSYMVFCQIVCNLRIAQGNRSG